MAPDLEKIREICDCVAASMGLEVVEVAFQGGAGKQGRKLVIYIDRPWVKPVSSASLASNSSEEFAVMGVTHEDCANLSREVSTILDVEDAIPGGEYLLEVSSPGLDRKLKNAADFERFTGSRVKLMTREPVGVTEKSKGNRHFEGRLESFSGGCLVLDLSDAPRKAKSHRKAAAGGDGQKVEIDLANVERANLVPEI